MPSDYDAVIVGGGAAGLNAALLLGRARRRVLLCDNGYKRNDRADNMHGFLSRDGTPPGELEKIARAELDSYPSVCCELTSVRDIERRRAGFVLSLENGDARSSDLVLLATGMIDALPDIDGLSNIWGRSAFVCPYCDGWEVRDRPIAIASDGVRSGIELAQELFGWTHDIVVCGHADNVSTKQAKWIAQSRVRIETEPIEKIIDEHGRLLAVVLKGGKTRRLRRFVSQRSPAAALRSRNAPRMPHY